MIRWGNDSILTSGDDIQETGGHINDADCLKALQAASELHQNNGTIINQPVPKVA